MDRFDPTFAQKKLLSLTEFPMAMDAKPSLRQVSSSLRPRPRRPRYLDGMSLRLASEASDSGHACDSASRGRYCRPLQAGQEPPVAQACLLSRKTRRRVRIWAAACKQCFVLALGAGAVRQPCARRAAGTSHSRRARATLHSGRRSEAPALRASTQGGPGPPWPSRDG